MMIKIKNWKLTLLSIAFIALFTCLGFWQLSRAQQKSAMLEDFHQRMLLPPVTAKDLLTPNDWRFYQVQLVGKFDDAHTILLDNKTFNGKVGYEVYTPFAAKDLNLTVLVDRGFIPMGDTRASLPAIPKSSKGTVTITGMINLTPAYVAFGEIRENGKTTWPLRVEYINLPEIAKLTNANYYPYVINLNPESPSALQVKWQITTVDPNKHKGYAVQWFALALTLLIISVVLNRAPAKKDGKQKSRARKTK